MRKVQVGRATWLLSMFVLATPMMMLAIGHGKKKPVKEVAVEEQQETPEVASIINHVIASENLYSVKLMGFSPRIETYVQYYQPDNAELIVAGKFDPSKALARVAETLGAIPRPARTLAQPYTAEPTQEGERSVMLRRVGNIQGIMVVYHIPAALHPDMAALDVLAQVLGAPQTGRLYKALVDNKKAVSASMSAGGMHDPGFVLAFAQLKPDQSIDEAQQVLLKTVEGLAGEPPSQEEVDRAKGRILKNIELALTNSQMIGMMLGGYAGDGDWRSFFLTRDEVNKVTPADVARVAKAYLKSSNRTLGEFVPTTAPDRAEIPATPDAAARFKDYKGGATIQQGEAFDPTPQNIEARAIRAKLPNGLKLVMFPKKTRGGTVAVSMTVRFGDEKSLFGKSTAGTMAGALLMRGTKNKNRQQIQDETDRLKAQMNVSGGSNNASASIRTLEANLADSLRFARELLREPSFPDTEFEQIRQQRIAGAESAKTEPNSLASIDLSRHFTARYPRGDVRYAATLDEQIEDLKKVQLDAVRDFYKQFYGAGEGEISEAIGAAIAAVVARLDANWDVAVSAEELLGCRGADVAKQLQPLVAIALQQLAPVNLEIAYETHDETPTRLNALRWRSSEPITTLQLPPPKPKALTMARAIGCLRACPRTRSSAQAGSGLSRCSVGGHVCDWRARIPLIIPMAPEAPAAPLLAMTVDPPIAVIPPEGVTIPASTPPYR